MGNSCFSKQKDSETNGESPTTDAERALKIAAGKNGRSKYSGRRRMRRGRRKRGSNASIGSPRITELSMSSESVYYDAADSLPEDGPGRIPRISSYQDGIDDYPSSPASSGRHTYRRTLQAEKAAQLAADADALLEPEAPSPTCLPRVFAKESHSQKFVRLTRPHAGSSLSRNTAAALQLQVAESVPEGAPATGASLLPTLSGGQPAVESWEDPGGDQFLVRGVDYSRTKKKELSGPSIYKLLAVDLYSFDFRIGHIAKHVQLPPLPVVGDQSHLPHHQRLPPLLIINVQLPDYPASLFGKNDGQGASLVYYFGLPDGWTPEQEPNQAAVGLLQRFVHNGVEADGSPTRDRLKLIARIVNVDEWAINGPLSSAEQALLRRYNDKPILTRPQQRFFLEPDYLEVDLDVHNYAYLARKAFTGFTNRLSTVVFDNAFVIQGNRAEELPEVVMAAARLSYIDFQKVRPFPADTMEHLLDDDSDSGASVADTAHVAMA